MKYIINGKRDLAIESEIKPYIGHPVTFVKVNKSGLYQVMTRDGRLLNIAKYNLDPAPSEIQPG